jgi:hypothetical protein
MNPLETYLKELNEIRASVAAVKETSYYGPLANLLNEIGKTLKPKVKCIINLQNQAPVYLTAGCSPGSNFRKLVIMSPGRRSSRVGGGMADHLQDNQNRANPVCRGRLPPGKACSNLPKE